MKKTFFKLTLIFVALIGISGCSSDDETDQTTGDIVGIWENGAVYGTGKYSGVNASITGDAEGTSEFRADGTYTSIMTGGALVVTVPTLNYTETTPLEPSTESGLYTYNTANDDLTTGDKTSKVVVLNANFMKIKTLINQDGVVGELYTEFNKR
ncbi:hypothetical protein ACFSX9_01700 [Flavobacterium ardleyense]|uniref:Lipocalin-like domain-containing protein n=1 Tax=Flavobacterium ardleyense TaxID=2038737 RepID=A0ABW5Z3N2_9FLAO